MEKKNKSNIDLIIGELSGSKVGKVVLYSVGTIIVLYVGGKVLRVLGGTIVDFKYFSNAIKS